MNQTKIYAIFITAILILGGPAGYFFTTKNMTMEIQEKDEKISKALETLKKAKESIENKDKLIESKDSDLLICNDNLTEKEKEIESLKIDLENAYAGISDDVISTEDLSFKKETLVSSVESADSSLENTEVQDSLVSEAGTGEDLISNSYVSNDLNAANYSDYFTEIITLDAMDLAYNKGLGKPGLPYVKGDTKNLLEMYNGEDADLKSKIGYFCSAEYLKDDVYGLREKSIVSSYQRSYCKDEKYENCPSEIKQKIDDYKSNKVLETNVVRVVTIYTEGFKNVNQEFFSVYDNFGKRACSWIRNTDSKGKYSYIQVR